MKKTLLLFSVLLAGCSTNSTPTSTIIESKPPPPSITMEAIKEDLPIIVEAKTGALMNLTPAKVITLLGTPSLVRRDDLMQVMLFEHSQCALDIVFYSQQIGEPYKVSFLVGRNRKGQTMDPQKCLSALKPMGFDK